MTNQIKKEINRKEKTEMTEQELIINITKGYSKNSNYYRKVQKRAYVDMQMQHHWCNYYKNIKRLILETKDIIYIDRTLNKYAQRQKAVTIYNKHHKRVLFTKYTKVPKYRTYRQQLAITNRSLYKEIQEELKYRNSYNIIK